LIRLRCDLPGDFSPEELLVKRADGDRLRELFSRWGFRTLLKEVEASLTQQGVLL
jgi:hypothetical protein